MIYAESRAMLTDRVAAIHKTTLYAPRLVQGFAVIELCLWVLR